jgi:esterase/lipase
MSRRSIAALAALAAILGAVIYATTPGALVNAASIPSLPDDLDAFIASSEQQAHEAIPLIPDTRKRVIWRQPGVRTEYAVVYLHGFSATRQETAPLAELVAEALGANLFETRLEGHGRAEMGLHGVVAEDWIGDAAEALAIGARLGDKVVIIGTSTGGTLALAMTGHESADSVSHVVLMSPNIQPRNETALWATRPAGRLIARVFVGPVRSWTPHNEQQARYWTTSYPTDAAIEMMRLVDYVDTRLDMQLDADLLVLLSPDDEVVSPDATKAAFRRINAPRKELHEIVDSIGPSSHILAGDILAPDSTERIAATIVGFIRGGRSPELRPVALSNTSPRDHSKN